MQPLEQLLSPIITNFRNIETNTLAVNDVNLLNKIKDQKIAVLEKRISPKEANLVRPEIVDSWIRSFENGLDPHNFKYPNIMDKFSFEERLTRKAFLLQAADPYFRLLENILSEMDCFIFLSDQDGVILRTVKALGNNKFQLIPGSEWSESTTGTCSHGMCILLKTPIQLCGPEHFCDFFDKISCSSAPVFDANGNLEGTLTFSSPYLHLQTSQSLGLVVTMAEAIQKDFQLSVKNDLLNVALESTRDAKVVIDNFGIITIASSIAHDMFKSVSQELTGMHIREILGSQPLIESVIETGNPIFNADIQINKGKQKISLRSIQPFINYDRQIVGCILTLRQFDKIKNGSKSTNGSETKFTFDRIIGTSHQSLKTKNMALKFARFGTNIIIQGESGTGKEVYAQAIHNESRPNGPFVALNCAAIPKNLIESELFGYEAGAFTGAERQGKPGKIELANGGTLFLDEIGDMPLELQAVLLRVLEDKMIVHVGGSRYIPVDFRVISATNKDLLKMVKQNQFREDLYYRISVFNLDIPPLRERGADIIELAEHFAAIAAKINDLPVPSFNNAAKYILLQFNWPGNVRQLQNAILYAVCMCNDGIIRPEQLPADILNYVPGSEIQSKIEILSDNIALENNTAMKDVEKMVIKKALDDTNNHIRDAAKILGLSKSTLYRKIKEYDLTQR